MKDLQPLAHDKTRTGCINGFIAAMQKQIDGLRKKATSSDLYRIDALSYAIRELEMARDMKRVDVGIRLQDLATVLADPTYDEDDKNLAKAGIAILNHVGTYMKKNGITA